MIERVAFFGQKAETEEYFGFKTAMEQIFDPHFNISPGQLIPVLLAEEEKQHYTFTKARWGSEPENEKVSLSVGKKDVRKNLQNKSAVRCILPLSGFYIWNNNDKKGSPFFVRMLNHPVMAVAGLYYQKEDYVVMVATDSNPLIHPMSEKMPLILDEKYSLKWIDKTFKTDDIIDEISNLFLLTDFSVLRVSKKVNDPNNNDPELIQPIPK